MSTNNQNLNPAKLEDENCEIGLRPSFLGDFIGQTKLKENLEIFLNSAKSRSDCLDHTLFYGPPGLGKTTLAQIIAHEMGVGFKSTSGPVISKSGDLAAILTNLQAGDILFIDEIHRFNKSQQDSLLGAVEKGIVTLIGATTENPSFEVISALLSRCQVFVLRDLEKEDLMKMLLNAMEKDETLRTKKISIKENEALLRLSGGDARKLLNLFELVVNTIGENNIEITGNKKDKIKCIEIYNKFLEMDENEQALTQQKFNKLLNVNGITKKVVFEGYNYFEGIRFKE